LYWFVGLQILLYATPRLRPQSAPQLVGELINFPILLDLGSVQMDHFHIEDALTILL